MAGSLRPRRLPFPLYRSPGEGCYPIDSVDAHAPSVTEEERESALNDEPPISSESGSPKYDCLYPVDIVREQGSSPIGENRAAGCMVLSIPGFSSPREMPLSCGDASRIGACFRVDGFSTEPLKHRIYYSSPIESRMGWMPAPGSKVACRLRRYRSPPLVTLPVMRAQ